MSSSRRNSSEKSNGRRKKTTDRIHQQFGGDLNDQDFGVSSLTNLKQQSPRAINSSKHKKTNSNKREPDQLIASQEALEAFCDDVGSLWCGFGAVPVLDEPPSPLVFLRDYVSQSRPCIIRNAVMVRDARRNNTDTTAAGSHLSLSLLAATTFDKNNTDNDTDTRPLQLSLDDIVDMDPDLEVVVDATPDGHGDVVRSVLDQQTGQQLSLFVTPEQRRMTLAEFRTQLRDGRREQRKQQTKRNSKMSRKDSDASRPEEGDENDLEFEEEVYDKSDGRRIFSLKQTQKPKNPKHDNNEDNIFASCNPGMISPTAGCNPLNDMGDFIMPFFNDLLVDSSKKNPQESKEPEEPPPPPPPPPAPPSVLYYSRQNDCFRNELPSIYEATRHVIPASLDFAEEAFGTGAPEAVNLWMGDERSVSSMHKDPYENMFYVASGEKLFTLCPPADAPYLYEQDFMSGSFDSMKPRKKKKSKRRNKNRPEKKRRWSVKTGYEDPTASDDDSEDGSNSDSSDDDDINLNGHGDENERPVCPQSCKVPASTDQDESRPAYVRWIEADVAALTDTYYERQQLAKFPLLKYAHPIHQVRVQAGELLYLPALWFHRVTQSRETIGLNYWYNMNFQSPQWCYFQLLNQLQLKAAPALPPPPPPADSDRRRRSRSRGHDDDDGAEKKHGY